MNDKENDTGQVHKYSTVWCTWRTIERHHHYQQNVSAATTDYYRTLMPGPVSFSSRLWEAQPNSATGAECA